MMDNFDNTNEHSSLAPDPQTRIDQFVNRFDESYRWLACYAALPLVLTPDLLHYLRTHFLRGQVPWVAEIDLLLSDLCRPAGYEQYVMDSALRVCLIEDLKEEFGEERMQQVARLLIDYINQLERESALLSEHQLRSQRWAALVCLDDRRDGAVKEIATRLRDMVRSYAEPDSTSDGNTSPSQRQAELAHLVRLTQELAPHLAAYPQLVAYAAQVSNLLRHPFGNGAEQPVIKPARVLDVEMPAYGEQPVSPDVVAPISSRLFPTTIEEWREEAHIRNEIFGKPAGYWCYVRPGSYRIGGWKEGEEYADIELPGFWIAKHPITVAQYKLFMEAGGYNNKNYWTRNGSKWKKDRNRKEPYYWNDEKYNEDTQPVVGITWYEATAFAAWLTEQLKSVMPQGSIIRLPTDAEWEAAAAYDATMHRRIYPWGDEPEPTPEHAVYKDEAQNSKPDRPAPVGGHPLGTAACGAHDIVGNVWEWLCSGHDGYPMKSGDIVKDFQTDDRVALRGSSWWNGRTNVRCLARGGDDPGDDDINWGGRLVWFVSP